MIERIIVAGGGTGGHLFPGIAVVEELRRRMPALEAIFVGTERGIEARILPARGERVEFLDVTPLKGRSPQELIQSALRLPRAMSQAASIVRRFKPQVVLGVGGYAAGPMVLAAAGLGVSTALMEQNAHVGMTNRMLSPLVGRAYLTFESTAPLFRRNAARVVGNPVRRSFVEAAKRASSDPEGFESRARTILVLGGSQGARVLNETVPQALHSAGLSNENVRIVHQTGAAMHQAVVDRYASLGVRAEVVPFIDEMDKAYASAMFVIARAGATTLAELCAIGRASILVPFKAAADDHQTKNAEELARKGAAICISESELAAALPRAIETLYHDRPERLSMAASARSLGRPDAAAAIADDLCAWRGCVIERREVDDDSASHPISPREPTSSNEAEENDNKRDSFAWTSTSIYALTCAARSDSSDDLAIAS